MESKSILYVNHIKAKVCCHIIADSHLSSQIIAFFSMFQISEYNIGCKCIGIFEIYSCKTNICLNYLKQNYVFGSIYEGLMFVADSLLCIDEYMGCYHGAVCQSPNGKAIALIGETMAGKTSLNMFLCKSGFKYLSDDVVLINEDYKVLSLPIPVKVRSGIIYSDSFYDKFIICSNNEYKILGSLSNKTTECDYEIDKFFFFCIEAIH